MTRRLPRELNPDEERAIDSTVPLVAELLIRLGRSYVRAVSAPNMEENEEEHKNFAKNLGDLVKMAAESRVFD